MTSVARLSVAPDVPTAAESGVPQFEIAPWFGVLAPSGTPPNLVARIAEDFRRALQRPELRDPLSVQGVSLIGSSPGEFAAHIAREIPRWAKIVKESGARAD